MTLEESHTVWTLITRISREELKSLSYRGFDLSKFSSKRGLTYENSTYRGFVGGLIIFRL